MKQDQANMVNYMNTLAGDIKKPTEKRPQTNEETSAGTTRSRERGR